MNRFIAACIAGAALGARGEGLEDLAWMAGTWMERKGAMRGQARAREWRYQPAR